MWYIRRVMTARELLTARDRLSRQIAELDKVIHEIALSGFAAASTSSGAGSRSYTRANLSDLRNHRAELVGRLDAVLSRLGGSPSGIKRIMIVRS